MHAVEADKPVKAYLVMSGNMDVAERQVQCMNMIHMNMLLYYRVHVVETMHCLSCFKRLCSEAPKALSLVLKSVCRGAKAALKPESLVLENGDV